MCYPNCFLKLVLKVYSKDFSALKLTQASQKNRICRGESQMGKNLDSPNPFSQRWEKGKLELCLSSPKDGRGAGGEGKDLSTHWD
jgi:hypothetical protein